MSGIRLAYLISQYPTITHTFILREIRGLRERGFDIEVISIRPPDRPWEKLGAVEQAEARMTFCVLRAGVGTILAAHLATLSTRPLRYLASWFYALRLAGLDLRKAVSHTFYFAEAIVVGWRLHRRGLTHVHTHFSSTVALFLTRVFPITFSATIHGSDEFMDPLGFYLREKVAAAKFICAISDYGASQLMKASDPRDWPKLEVNRLGVDTSVFLPRPHRRDPEPIELLSVGSLVPPKGYPILLSAIARLASEGGKAIRLRIVGEGAGRSGLQRMIAARGLESVVTLMGSCGQEQLRELYRETDLFILASFAEGIPVVLMEAMAMEIPCIATWITGIPELIRHGVDGWLVPPGNEQQLADAVTHLLANAELRQALGKSARIRVSEQYELARNVSALARTYERRLAGAQLPDAGPLIQSERA